MFKNTHLCLIILCIFFVIPHQTHSYFSIILNNLTVGSTGEEVKQLQVNLNKDPDTKIATSGPGSPGNETLYFGPATREAVIKFQDKHATQVLYPIGLTEGTGYFGPLTRLWLNILMLQERLAAMKLGVISNDCLTVDCGKSVSYTTPVSTKNSPDSKSKTPGGDTATSLSADITKPTTPTNLTVAEVTSNSVKLSWVASVDPVLAQRTTSGVSYYVVYYGDLSLKTNTPDAHIVDLTPDTLYSFSVVAVDGANNQSEHSTSFTVKTELKPTVNVPPSISGTPDTNVIVSNFYNFTPVASDEDNDVLTFSITNKPSWATFNTKTGQLSGTPNSTGLFENVTISVTDNNTAPLSLPSFSITVKSKTVPTVSKYNPGHYVVLTGSDVRHLDDSLSSSKDGAVFVKTMRDSGVVGINARYSWKELEPTEGNYDFSRVKKHMDLANNYGLKFIVWIGDKSFQGAPTPLPDFIMDNTEYWYSSVTDGYNATRWNPYVHQRIKLLVKELGVTFDSHPALEGVSFQETATNRSSGTVTTPPYDPKLYRDTIIDTLNTASDALPSSNVFWYMNFLPSGYSNGVFLSNSITQTYLGDIGDLMASRENVIIGGPDILPENESLLTRVYPFYDRFYKNGSRLFGSMQNDSYRELHSTSSGSTFYPTTYWTPLEMFVTGRDDLHFNYVMWNYKNWLTKGAPAGEYRWTDAVPVIKANPTFNPTLNQKFKVGDRVQTSKDTYVHATTTSHILGSQPVNAKGSILIDSFRVKTSTTTDIWWKVNFETGTDGWINQNNLILQ